MNRIISLYAACFSILFFIGVSHNGFSQQKYELSFRRNPFIPEPAEYAKALFRNFEGRKYGIIQFSDIPTEEEKEVLIRQGIELLDYMPENAWFFSAPAALEIKVKSSKIRAVLPLPEGNKMDPALVNGNIPSWALREGGKADLQVQVYRKQDVQSVQVLQQLQNMGAEVLESQPEFQTITIRMPVAQIQQLVSEPWLQWMEPVNPQAQRENLPGKNLHRSSTLEYGIRNLTGSGVKVAIWDGGEVGKHQDFENRLTLVETSAPDDHASHVMGTIGGAGILNPTARGMAPGSTLFSYNFSGDVAAEMQAQQPLRGFTIASHSWGFGDSWAISNCATGDPYNSTSRSQDLVLINYPNLLHVHSSGNSQAATGCGGWRTTTGKAAKNTLVVGNAQINETISGSSSTGPVQDGRLKPEISALGTSVFSTTPNNSYMNMSGTSMATPGVSGVMAQIVQRYRQLNSNSDPRSSLLKALVCNTARDRGTAGPDYRFGYGIINGLKAVTAMEENRFEVNSISNGGSYTKTIAVPAGIAQIRVMITWLDPAGAANANPALINNLNLTVTNPSSTAFNPWILDPANPANAAVRGVDNRNNIEQVTISNPAAGNYTVTISGTSVPSGPQQYALTWEFDVNGIQILYPNGGEVLQPGTNNGSIFWDSYGVTGNQTVEYSTNNGSSWTSLGTVASTVNNASWTVPSTVSSQYLMRITQGSLTDQSDANFSVIGTPTGLAFAQGCTVGQMVISWSAVSGATGYDVMKLDTATSTWNVFAANVSVPNFTATGLAAAQRHFFAVRAKTTSVTGLRCSALVTSGEHTTPFSVTALADASSGCSPLNTTLRAIGTATTYTSGTVTFSTISGTPTNITTWTGDADDGFTQVSLPFSFKFYNTDYSSVFISTNGFVSFGSGSAANAPNSFPTASAPNNVVALCFADLNLTSSGSCGYFTSGTAPNRRFVIQYTNAPPYSGTGTLSGQLVFFEGSNIIEMYLSNQNLSTLKTQGLENSIGTVATTISGRNNANWTAANDGLRFTPTLPATYVWSPATGLSSTSVQYPTVSATATGSYTVSVTYSGCTSSSSVNLSVQNVPAQPGLITGSSSVCSGAARTYSIATVATATSYSWSLPSGWSGTSASNSINATTGSSSGNISVSGVNACGTGTARSLAVTAFSAVPAQPGSITGTASVCSGAAQSYSIAAVSGSESYSWSLPSGWSGTSASTSIIATTGSSSGNISVSGVNACGTGTARSLAVTAFSAVPAQPGSITGAASVCSGAAQSYSIASVSGSQSYSWSLPSGWSGTSASISMNATTGSSSGNISVSGVNACGTGTARSLAVTAFSAVPPQPSAISATNSICAESAQIYSISTITTAENYHWTFPAGFTPASSSGAAQSSPSSQAGTTGGTVSVYASNACGNGAVRNFSVSVTNIPATPGVISGDASVCNATLNAYSVSAVPEATSYSWTLPSGWSGSSSSSSINANAGPGDGIISVRAENFCGSSAAQNISVTSISIPAQPAFISFTSDVCFGSTENYSVAPMVGATSYVWTLPSGWSGSSASTSISATASTISGLITVKAANTCGSSTAAGLSVNSVSIPAQPSSISGSTTGTAGLGLLYSISTVPAATSYVWTLPSGWTGSSASSSITVTPNSVSGSISVAAQNFCGTGPARSLFITSTDPSTGLELNTWLGIFNTPAGNNWQNMGNWSASNGVPTAAQLARIPAGTPFSPQLTGIQPAGAVQIENGASVHLGGSNALLQVVGNLTTGTGQITGPGSVVLVGSQNQNLYGNLVLQNLRIQKTGGSLQVAGVVRIKELMQFENANASLTIQPGANLIFHSDENGTGKLGPVPAGMSISGEVTTERKLNYPSGSEGNWFFMSSPVSGKKFSDWGDDFTVFAPGSPYFGDQPGIQPAPGVGNTTVFKYVESLHNIKSDEVQKIGWRIPFFIEDIEPGRGYRVWVNRYSNSSGKFDNTGNITYGPFTFPTLTRNHFSPCYPLNPGHPSDECNTDQRGWNLLANPYPCDINWDGPGWTKPATAEMGNAFYTWNNPAGGYGFYSAGSYLGVTPAPANPNIIPSGQAFFVRINNPGTQTIQINENAKITSASGQFLRTASAETKGIRMRLSRGPSTDEYGFEAEIRFSGEAIDDFEPGLDFASLGSNRFHFSVSVGNEKCILSHFGEIGELKIIPLEMNFAGETGSFRLGFSISELFQGTASVFLKDKQLQTLTPIGEASSYLFSVEPGMPAADRFELLVSPAITRAGQAAGSPGLQIFPNPAKDKATLLFAEADGIAEAELLDQQGRLVRKIALPPGCRSAEVSLEDLPAGVFCLRVRSRTGVFSSKLVKY